MDWSGWAVFGFIGTLVLTGIMLGANLLGLTRMGMPLVLGSMVADDVDRARTIGAVLHVAAGMVFAFLYAIAFAVIGEATWWLGGLFGVVHGLAVLILLLPALPAVHPHMASDRTGPALGIRLQPPGPLGLHYGASTPVVTLLAHVSFGVVLGSFLSPR